MVKKIAQRWRERGAHFDPRAGAGLAKGEFGSVQEITAERRQDGVTDVKASAGAVKRVAHNGVFQRREVHADLVGAASVQLHFDESGFRDASENAPVGA